MTKPTLPGEVAAAVVDPVAYGQWEPLHDQLAWARANAPLAVAENADHDPFWLVTRHADIMAISRDPQRFANGIRPTVLTNRDGEALARAATPNNDGHLIRSLVQMDAPDHMKYRLLTQSWFMPKNLKMVEDRIRQIARDTVDHMLEMGGECDFARDVAAHYPLRVIMDILGVPPEDEPRMLMLTQQLFGPTDPELNRSREAITSADQAIAMLGHVIADFENYFGALTAERRAHPREDIATVIANATINGERIPDREMSGYYMIVATAGHDTTSASTAGAIMELAKNPALFDRFRDAAADKAGLIEEAIRWSTPVQHFMRSAKEDVEIGGQTIREGDWLMLNYVSANRDESVFADPFAFDPDREKNQQIAFGFGAHVCLGQHLARMEMRILMEELLPRLKRLELAGAPARVESVFVGGLKRLPLRFEAA
ncbi:cytochrome P450 [Sphingopyxis sp. RIFCSPHIGHO2_12_FULL_65_19]|uniref:cytochrome P450 n=1 Tax=Sphingopyxis sp. RIFCSPHIGHO2_12_FULL_65_19 TaxID=1802172 RepID=UPI0008D17AC5|nr:cytochrome P450 [Sphingopyxis sp. RIFCSPHIGHO2_12_FULL_65_19]OHD07097.1 MAG: cytochrome [Sphingopyxis sp. RIFCSPHIGHO2_12_FULL_65_19]